MILLPMASYLPSLSLFLIYNLESFFRLIPRLHLSPVDSRDSSLLLFPNMSKLSQTVVNFLNSDLIALVTFDHRAHGRIF